jgi:hypothetical protein
MNKGLTILIFISASTLSAISQSLSFKTDIGVGTFYMVDLKDVLSTSKPDLGVEIKTVSNFPPYFGYCLSMICYTGKGFGAGPVLDFYSTGGRNYYEDYSGSYSLECIAKALDVGLVFDFLSYSNNRNKVYVEVQTGMKFSTLDVNEKLMVTKILSDETSQFVNISYWLKPGFRYEFSVFKFLSAGAFLGGELNPKGILHLKDNKETHIINSSGNNVTISWTGIRASLSLSFNLDTKVVAVPVK